MADSSRLPLACFNRVDSLAKALMSAVGIIIVSLLTGYKDIKQPLDPLALATALFLIVTLVFGYVLWIYVNYMSNPTNLTTWQYLLHVALVSFSGVCLMCTNVLLLAMVNPVNALLACCLVVVPFTIVILAYAGSRIDDTNQSDRDAFEAVMKRCCDVAYLIVRGSFSMHVAVVFEYYKNQSLRVNQFPSVDLSVTFLASMLGVFSMMATSLPLELLPPAMRSKLLFIFNLLKNSMLILTTVAAIILGGKFLQGLVLLVLMPISVVIVAYQSVLLLTGDQRVNPDPENPQRDDPLPNEELEIPAMLTSVTNTCLVLLSAFHALYNGGENNGDVYVRVGIFLLVGIIASCLTWVAFLLNHSMNEQRAKVTKLIIGILLLFMIIIAASFLVKIMYRSV